MSFGRQPPPNPESGGEEPPTDSGVVPEGLGEHQHVSARLLAPRPWQPRGATNGPRPDPAVGQSADMLTACLLIWLLLVVD